MCTEIRESQKTHFLEIFGIFLQKTTFFHFLDRILSFFLVFLVFKTKGNAPKGTYKKAYKIKGPFPRFCEKNPFFS